jgi:hypothetical protein
VLFAKSRASISGKSSKENDQPQRFPVTSADPPLAGVLHFWHLTRRRAAKC